MGNAEVQHQKIKKLTTMGVMAAVSVMLLYAVHIPWPAAPYLEYDPADVPIFICAFLYGPVSGFVLTVVASLVQGITVSAGSGPIGILMHIFSTGSYVLVAGTLYKRNKTKKGAAMALCAGVLTAVVVMCVWNVILTPVYTGLPRETVIGMLIPIIIPFNFVTAGANSLITFFVYKKISSKIFHN